MSTEAFKRVLWIILDGMGFEHARRCLDSGRFPALARMAREGYLGPSRPSSPGCQTPTALLGLFSGAGPAESGVWGYYMPDPARVDASISGFHAQPHAIRTIWHELEEKGQQYSLMNVAFRNDRVWSGSDAMLDFGFDGYRLWKRPCVYRLGKAEAQDIDYRGLRLRVSRTRAGVVVRKGASVAASVDAGCAREIRLTKGNRVLAHLLDPSNLMLSHFTQPAIRGAPPDSADAGGFLDANAFRLVRRLNEQRDPGECITVPAEMVPSAQCMARKADLMMGAIRGSSSRLVVGYFPLIDEYNHVYADLLEREWPNGRASELFSACAALVDQLLAKVMSVSDPQTLVVVSSDHGVVPYHGVLHVNEVLAAEGLVRRAGPGYDLNRSTAYYHPSDCGLVVARNTAGRPTVLARVKAALARARQDPGVETGIETSGLGDPCIAFLYPMGAISITGDPPGQSGAVLDRKKSGGHHLSPLSPTPWIQAMLGLWSPRSTSLSGDLGGVPVDNLDMKRFLLRMMGAG